MLTSDVLLCRDDTLMATTSTVN